MEVLFYHLERATLDGVLPQLLEKTLERGWRAIVRGGSGARLEALDTHLWTWGDGSFLAHGMAGSEHDARQPVVLTTGQDNSNNASVLFVVDQADMAGFESYERAVVVFDGGNKDALNQARADWKAIRETDHDATYWRQSPEGKWEKQG